jgi:hypothetical protein
MKILAIIILLAPCIGFLVCQWSYRPCRHHIPDEIGSGGADT